MNKKRKRKVIMICLFLIMLLSVSVSYSLLLSKLNIGGNGKISKNSWDIYFENINIKDGSINGTINSISETGLSFDVMLNEPGDYLEFSVDVVNAGSLDAMVDNFILSDISNYSNIINYEVKYFDNESIRVKDKLSSGETDTLLIKVEYKRDITVEDLTSEDIDIEFSFEIDYVQDDGTGRNRHFVLANVFGEDIKDGSNLILNKQLDKEEVGVYSLNDVTFFRGYDLDNNVIVGDSCYKILTVKDGVVKLLYNGNLEENKCNSNEYYIGLSSYSDDSSNDNYLSSNTREYLMDWYNSNLIKYDSYLIGGYCNDISMEDNVYSAKNRFTYGNVSYNCENYINDKIGLLTIDDVMLIGYGMNGGVSTNSDSLKEYYLMTPHDKYEGKVNEFYITNSGDVHSEIVTTSKAIRPVIQLDGDIKINDGLGTVDNPYILELNV